MRSNGTPSHHVADWAGIAADELGTQFSAAQVLSNPGEPLRVDVDRHQLAQMWFPFGDERRFSAGRGAGIEHPLTGRQAQGKCDALRSQVLHGNHALRKPGQVLHVARRIQHHRRGHARFGARADPGLAQLLKIGVGGGALGN